jgi:regulatory protein
MNRSNASVDLPLSSDECFSSTVNPESVRANSADTEEQQQASLKKQMRRAAMNMLARRDHSQKELYQKLVTRFQEKHLAQAVIDQLAEDGLQSDANFTEAYIRFRASKGYGPERIFLELSQKGISESLANRCIAEAEINWFDLLEEQYQKKFQSRKPETLEEKAKMQRFLVYRGFNSRSVNDLLG